MMKNYKITHPAFGVCNVLSIDNGKVSVETNSGTKTFLLRTLDVFFKIEDEELKKQIEESKISFKKEHPDSASISPSFPTVSNDQVVSRHSFFSDNELLGSRALTISVSEHQMFEIVGYMARPGRIRSIEAEIPKDGRDKIFERLFPGQTYRPIETNDTPSGLPNKLSAQFRINFLSLRNCPSILRQNMGAGNASCVGRINKSRFVVDIVQNYGFKFGYTQDVNKIREIAQRKGYIDDFEKGFAL